MLVAFSVALELKFAAEVHTDLVVRMRERSVVVKLPTRI